MTSTQLARLGHWLASWVQSDGAIFGFHNHPIWGSNPYRMLDFTSGHATFAAPLAMGLARCLEKQFDPRGAELLRKIIGFQSGAIGEDGQFNHIGFQLGDSLRLGLIHNAIAAVALADTVLKARQWLAAGQAEVVQRSLVGVLETCDRLYPNQEAGSGTANQEYCRTWARMLFERAFDDNRWHERSRRELHQFINDFHRRGFPDEDSAASLRGARETFNFEPAEYYGLLISPLLLGFEIYGDAIFLDEAKALARHVVRSSWVDEMGQRRLHRMWARTGRGGAFECIREPMCIGGSGTTGAGIRQLLAFLDDDQKPEFADFLRELNATYAHYQHPAGFFLSASGWSSELDIAPSSAWHAHDFYFLAGESGALPTSFWHQFFAPDAGRDAILLGEQCLYIERGAHWAVANYFSHDTFLLRGRKDRDRFGVHLFDWVPSFPRLDPELKFENLPSFFKTDREIVLLKGDAHSMDIVSFAGLPWRKADG